MPHSTKVYFTCALMLRKSSHHGSVTPTGLSETNDLSQPQRLERNTLASGTGNRAWLNSHAMRGVEKGGVGHAALGIGKANRKTDIKGVKAL